MFVVGLRFHVKALTHSVFFLLTSIFMPLLVATVAYYLMWLLCGVNIPPDVLPGWLAQIGRLLPLTHGIAAGREVASGATLASVSGLVWTEVAVGTAWAAIALTLVWLFEHEGRRRASLETF